MIMRIGLNLLHAMPEIGGGWYYISRLVRALGENDRENSYVAFVTNKSVEIVPQVGNFEIVQIGINPVSRVERVLYENTRLQMAAWKYRLDLMHWFANTLSVLNSIPGVVTVYDLQVFENPHSFPWMQRTYLVNMFSHTIRRAALLLPMSEATAHSLCTILKACSERLRVIPAIIDGSFQPISDEKVNELRRKYSLPKQFWLYVAHFYPHKNHLRLVQSYHNLKLKGFTPWPLLLRGDDHGDEKEIRRLVRELGLEKDVRFLSHLNEAELAGLYSAATAMVFPSLYEGGGMPILEAMACGCPVIAANIPAVREFAGEAASFFDPKDTASIEEAMSSFQLNGPKVRWKMRCAGLERCGEFRPRLVAYKLLKAYARAVSM